MRWEPTGYREPMSIARASTVRLLASALLAACLALLSSTALAQSSPKLPGVTVAGVFPQLIRPGEKVRIVLSAPAYADVLKVYPQERAKAGVSVQMGGRLATVIDLAPDTIVVESPRNLRNGEKIEVQVLGWGVSASAGASVEALQFADFFDENAWFTFGGVFVAGLAGTFWLRQMRSQAASREAELKAQLDKLKLREEKRLTGPTGESPPTDEGDASALPPLIPKPPVGLIESINRGECTLFWGAGLSAQAGYPTWHQLLNDIVDGLKSDGDAALAETLQQALNARQASLAAEILVTRLGRGRVVEMVRDHIRETALKPASAIDELSRMAFANVLTSTWDGLVDRAFAGRQPAVVIGVSSGGLESLLTRDRFCQLRLWGSLERPDSVLFTPSEYRTAVGGNQDYAKYVTSLALSQTHFFVGATLETIEMYLAGTSALPKSRTHYALVSEEPSIELSREVFRERYGVELLVYRPTPGWPEVAGFVRDLKQAIDAAGPVAPRVEIEPFRLVRVELENIGPFESCKLALDPNWTVLLGNNGSGKSTLLRAIALVLCGDDQRSLAVGRQLLRVGKDKGFIELQVGDTAPYRIDLARDGERVVVSTGTRVSPLRQGRWVALAFPPLRGASTAEPKGPTNAGSSKPLVEDVLPILIGQVDERIASLKQWLVNLDVASTPSDSVSEETAKRNRRLRDHFFDVFNAFVPGVKVSFAHVDRATWRVHVRVGDIVIGLDQVSQGTSSALGWVGALMQRMYEIHGVDRDIRNDTALVLIDELDAHLHPEWQQRIATTLREQFPNVQFIATTHSPLIVGELERKQIYRVRTVDGRVVAEHPSEEVRGLGVGGLLTGDAFGLRTIVDRETQRLLERQRELSLIEKLEPEQVKELDDTNRDLEKLGFRYEMRDPEYMAFLRSRYGPDGTETSTGRHPGAGAPNERVKGLIRQAAEMARRSKS